MAGNLEQSVRNRNQPPQNVDSAPARIPLKDNVLKRLAIVIGEEENWPKAVEIVESAHQEWLASQRGRARREYKHEHDRPPDPHTFPVASLGMHNRVTDWLSKHLEVHFVGQLYRYSEMDLLAYPAFGPAMVRALRLALAAERLPPLQKWFAESAKKNEPTLGTIGPADLVLAEGELAAAEEKAGRLRAVVEAMRAQLKGKA